MNLIMKQLLIVIASLLLGALAQDLRRTIPTPLYVWGNGIPGLSLFYADGEIYNVLRMENNVIAYKENNRGCSIGKQYNRRRY
jgi:hypothetical protein